jgi:hypothetical protein
MANIVRVNVGGLIGWTSAIDWDRPHPGSVPVTFDVDTIDSPQLCGLIEAAQPVKVRLGDRCGKAFLVNLVESGGRTTGTLHLVGRSRIERVRRWPDADRSWGVPRKTQRVVQPGGESKS